MAGSPDITTLTLPDGPVGFSYPGDIAASGGTGDLTFSLTAGSLPPGLVLQSPGIGPYAGVFGVPTTAGVYSFTITVTDAAMNTGSQGYVVTIYNGSGSSELAVALPPATFGSVVYEIFQLCDGPNGEEGISVAEITNKMGEDGYRTRVRYGAETGLRRFKLNMPQTAGFIASKTISYLGGTYTPEDYIWTLFMRRQPFVIRSNRNNQNYLVEFTDHNLDYARFLTKLYSSTLQLEQIRIPGVSVFDPKRMKTAPWGWWGRSVFANGSAFDISGNGRNLTVNGNVAEGSPHNGWRVNTFNAGGTNTGYLSTTLDPVIYEAFFVVKFNEATFSGYESLISGGVPGSRAVYGEIGTTRFAETTVNGAPYQLYEYRKDGVVYENGDQQAPMNEFGLVHIQWPGGVTLMNLQIGKLEDLGVYSEMDLGEAILFDGLNSYFDSLELAESLMDIWDI
jgi:hypothetical protein